MSSRRSSGAGAASTRATRQSEAPAASKPSAKKKSPASAEAEEEKSAARTRPAADEFEFAEDDTTDVDMTDDGERKTSGGSAKKKKGAAAAAAATPAAKKKTTAATPKSSGKRGSAKKKAAQSDEEEEAASASEEQKGDDEAEEDASALSPSFEVARPVRSSTGSQLTKEEQARLMNADTIKACMGNKDQLAKTLKKLAHVLADLHQGASTLTASGKALAAVLIEKSILKHKSEEVRSVAACCIADLFRHFAPTPPYTEPAQLKVVFHFFIEQLAHLAQPSHQDAAHHFFLLETIDNSRIAEILTHTDGGEAILLQMAEIFFAVAKMDLSSVVTQHILSILSNVLAAFDSIPPILLDEILRHFTSGGMQENEGGTRLAILVVQRNVEVLERPICAWLHQLLVERADAADVDTSITEHEDHVSILCQLSIHCNTALEMFLQKDALDLLTVADESAREEYTDVFCKTFSSANVSAQNPSLMAINQPLFDQLLERFLDKSPKIRYIIAKASGAILIRQMMNQANKERILNLISDTAEDRDESVRVAIIESIRLAGLTEAEAIPVRLVSAVTGRAMDRKQAVRNAAVRCLADLFGEHCAPQWRSLQPSPKSVNQYLLIPRKLAQMTRVDNQMALAVDILYDERILGANESIEARTKALLGLFLGLHDKTAMSQPTPKRLLTAPVDDSAAPEVDPNEARKIFSERILGRKVAVQKVVVDLLMVGQQLAAAGKGAKSDAKVEQLERQKNGLLAGLGRLVHFEQDGTLDDLIQVLHLIFFESKDKNIAKYLRALADPLTEYQQIRLAQTSLHSCVKAMASGLPKKKGVSPANLAARLGSMLGLTLTPIESIEIIYQLMAENVAKKNHVMLKACQELLLLIASKVPILLTHPGTIDAMLINLTHSDDEWNLTNTLQILSAIKDGGKGMKANKKTASKFLSKLTQLALEGAPSHAQLAVECIQGHWGAPRSFADLHRLAQANGGALPELEETQADDVLHEILREHASANMQADSPQLHTALAVAAKIAEINFPLLQEKAATQRKLILLFCLTQLLPCESDQLLPLHEARIAALVFLQNYVVAHGRSENFKPAAPAGESGAAAGSSSDELAPKNLLTILLKIVKLDGRFPDAGKTTTQQLEEATQQEEDADEKEARLEFLLTTALAILECCTVALYHRFFIHPPPEATKQMQAYVDQRKCEAQAAKQRTGVSGMLSPRAPPAEVKMSKHALHFASVAFLAVYPEPEVSRRFLERIIELMKISRLSYSFYISVLSLAATHPSEKFSFNTVKHAIGALTRRVRHQAKAIEERHQVQQDALTAAAASVAAAASAKKKGSRKKKKGAENEEEDEEVEAADAVTHAKHPANSAMPEYAIADLVYLLSYHPNFLDEHVLRPTEQQRQRMHQEYDEMLQYIDYFLDCLLHDSGVDGGGHFDLLFAILGRIRESYDVRNIHNQKIYKLAELATLSVQQRMAHDKWSSKKYDSVQLSPMMFVLRDTPPKERYLPADYKLPDRHHHHATGASGEGAASTGGTPKRKRKSDEHADALGSEKKKRTKKGAASEDAGSVAMSEDEDEKPRRKSTGSASKPKKERALKEESTPSRSRLGRGAKEAIKYTEGESDEDMDDADNILPTRKATTPRKTQEPTSGDEDEDVDMTSSSPKGSAKKKPTPAAASSAKKKPPTKHEPEEEEDEPMTPPSSSKKGGQSKMTHFMASSSGKK